MISEVTIKNFKSLVDTHTKLGMLNIFIGNNGSGKSSFFRALSFLRDVATFESINTALERRRVDFSDLVHLQAEKSRIEFSLRVVAKRDGRAIDADVALAIAKRRFCYIASETVVPHTETKPQPSVDISKLPYYLGRQNKSMVARDEGGSTMRLTGATLAHSFLRDVRFESRLQRKSSFRNLSLIADQLSNIQYFEIWGPDALRAPARAGILRMAPNGANMAAVLQHLRENHPAKFEELRTEMKRAYDWLEDIEFRPILEHFYTNEGSGTREAVTCVFVEKTTLKENRPHQRRYNAEQVSDGFLRLLAITTLRFSPTTMSVLLYEEPENGLHPRAIRHAAQHLRKLAASGVQVMVTTHSPLFLSTVFEDLSAEQIVSELKLVQRNAKGQTVISPPDPRVIASTLDQQIAIGDLWEMLLEEKSLSKGGI